MKRKLGLGLFVYIKLDVFISAVFVSRPPVNKMLLKIIDGLLKTSKSYNKTQYFSLGLAYIKFYIESLGPY